MTATTQFDILIIGAGISGIGAARYVKTELADKTFAVLEARENIGGTWDLFTYPGVRSDSDLYTFGYEFKPWRDKESIATAPRIVSYLQETAAENELMSHIRFGCRVVRAEWSSATANWTVDVEVSSDGLTLTQQITTRWIFCASGYYRYDEGYTPPFPGRDEFAGTVVHPQQWPANLDYTGKNVIVIGSGATAITLVPAMAKDVGHITMLQRTPTYIVPTPLVDPVAVVLKRIFSPDRAHQLIRAKSYLLFRLVWKLCLRYPNGARKAIRNLNARKLPAGYPVDEHFNPPYNPWDQRLCAAPDGDLFAALSTDRASMVTDAIDRFTDKGILLRSGRHLDADIIVTATGFNLQIAGGIELSVDGRRIHYPDTVIYRGTLLSGVPNFAMALGYVNASWTLKVGLLCQYFVKLVSYMDAHGHDAAWVVADPDMPLRPLLDFEAGYVQRSIDTLPKQGPAAPWLMSRDYLDDRKLLNKGDLIDRHLRFSSASSSDPVVSRP